MDVPTTKHFFLYEYLTEHSVLYLLPQINELVGLYLRGNKTDVWRSLRHLFRFVEREASYLPPFISSPFGNLSAPPFIPFPAISKSLISHKLCFFYRGFK